MTFPTPAETLALHRALIELHGGTPGIRDEGLLLSALAQAEASFGGEFLHRDPFEMAAAYGFHLSQNHPFLDGNKRVALAALLTFLEVNGIEFRVDPEELYAVMIAVADGRLDKPQLAAWTRDCAPVQPPRGC